MKYLLSKRRLSLPLIVLLICAASLSITIHPSKTEFMQGLDLTAQADKQSYNIREPVAIQGIFNRDGSPITDALVAMEIRDPRDQHFIFRTIQIGNPTEVWAVNITEVHITDLNNDPIDEAKIATSIRLSITVQSNFLNPLDIVIAYTLLDNNLIPIRTSARQTLLNPQATVTVTGEIYIPEWATPGKALVSANVYNRLPHNNGFPYTPENLAPIYITRNEEILQFYSPTPTSHQTQTGQYQFFFRMPPDEFTQPGTYSAYITGRETSMAITTTSTTFDMQANPSPPQAAFTYYPPDLYANMSATFDGSSSSAEGFNDTITRFDWFFDDPYNPEQIINQGNYTHPPSPLALHTFEYGGTYIVSLNVTDNEGLWSYTIKPVTIYPDYGPTANFTWTPPQPRVNITTTFNASISELGWSAQLADFSPIVQYKWNFDDGTGNVTIPSNPVISHVYTQPGNYTVTLTITDSVGRLDTILKDIEVMNVTGNPYDVNGDGYVGIDDVVLVAEKFGTIEGDPDWDPRCDINGDGYVGIDDIVSVAEHFGETS